MYSVHDTRLMAGGFPHSEIFGSKGVCHLPEAYRRLLRPSSPPTAKAFTVCAYSLDYIAQASKIFDATNYFHSSCNNFAGQMCKKYTLALKKFSVFNNYLFKEQLA